jgi:hypothetical protein
MAVNGVRDIREELAPCPVGCLQRLCPGRKFFGHTIERRGYRRNLVASILRRSSLQISLAEEIRRILHLLQPSSHRAKDDEGDQRGADNQHAASYEAHGGSQFASNPRERRTPEHDDFPYEVVADDDERNIAARHRRAGETFKCPIRICWIVRKLGTPSESPSRSVATCLKVASARANGTAGPTARAGASAEDATLRKLKTSIGAFLQAIDELL